jgi:hypothetical protein
MKNVINVFDFDGTLFNSPSPSSNLWDARTIGKLKNSFTQYGYGWYRNILTLSDKYIKRDDFKMHVVNDAIKSIKDPNAITVMLTGRTVEFEPIIRSLLDEKGLTFDYYGLKSVEASDSTVVFKQNFVKKILELNPSVDTINMWDDRGKHIIRFKAFLDSLGVKSQLHHIDEKDSVMEDESLERELVELLLKDERIIHKPSNNNVRYCGVMLSEESKVILIERLRDVIPVNWKVIANHMTISLGTPQKGVISEYLDTHMGVSVNLSATEIGISNDAIAVKINTDIPTKNKIPHITIAVPHGGRPVHSNDIVNWKLLNQHIELTGTIAAQY